MRGAVALGTDESVKSFTKAVSILIELHTVNGRMRGCDER
jgi:hypothetical protein